MAYDYGEVALGFATLSKLVETKLSAEYETGRIKGTEYADVFNQLMQEILRLSFDSPLKDSQKELADAQVADQVYVTQNIRPAELAEIECKTRLCEAQTADQEYVTENIRPHEAQLKEKELDLMAAKIDLTAAQVDIAEKELLLKQKEIDLAQEKITLMQKDADYKDAQIRFTDRQIIGFDDNLKHYSTFSLCCFLFLLIIL